MAFGEILKQKRLEHGWTREYIAERMNMRTCFVEMLETENLKRIVAPAYGRGYIRNYCRELGIDSKPLEADYNALIAAEGRGGDLGPVSHPNVRGLPEKPHEPIHTGAHRTLPPKEDPAAIHVSTGHKFVASAEALSTAVPKPEMPPVSTDTASSPVPESADIPPVDTPPSPLAQPAEEPFTLRGDELPRQPAAPAPAPMPESAPKPRTAIRQALPVRAPMPGPQGAIFGPQHPVEDPTSPWLGTLLSAGKAMVGSVNALIRLITRPKVRRLDAESAPFLTPRRIAQMSAMLVGLLIVTGLVFAFRYVFRMSEAAEVEVGLSGTTAPKAFTPRSLGEPPAPYFK
ncbi:MAG: helix-turn-helix domain-containing protein [Candidatus Spyradenecus sp.]